MWSVAPERWEATRFAGLERLRAFAPRAGRLYAEERNYDGGPGPRRNVSCLSPWIRHRLVLEEEVLETVLREHSPEAADKFIQQLCWRTYWKGWLEMRPQVWQEYLSAVTALQLRLESDRDLLKRWRQATAGETGIEPYDHWTRELAETGYLHNHTRMWFASIWVFTLDLPWQLGADFFLRNLLDGDAASNTLSWRWVAGLQTPGKTYLARADNIARYTHGRFRPHDQLSNRAEPPTEVSTVAARALPIAVAPAPERRTGLLLTEDDLCPETLAVPQDSLGAVAGFTSPAGRSPWPVSRLVLAFSSRALDDGLQRAADRFQSETTQLDDGELTEQLIGWCRRHRLEQILVPYVPVGVTRDVLHQAQPTLEHQGIRVAQIRRQWDERFWPHATRGYFPFKKAIGSLLEQYRDMP